MTDYDQKMDFLTDSFQFLFLVSCASDKNDLQQVYSSTKDSNNTYVFLHNPPIGFIC